MLKGGDALATARITPLHTGEGRSVAKALSGNIDYMGNPVKTEDGCGFLHMSAICELLMPIYCFPSSDMGFSSASKSVHNSEVSVNLRFGVNGFIL